MTKLIKVIAYVLNLEQFCDAGIGYRESTCGISPSSSSSKLLIKGGTVVNAHQQEIADVYVEDGVIVAVKPNIKVRCSCIYISKCRFVKYCSEIGHFNYRLEPAFFNSLQRTCCTAYDFVIVSCYIFWAIFKLLEIIVKSNAAFSLHKCKLINYYFEVSLEMFPSKVLTIIYAVVCSSCLNLWLWFMILYIFWTVFAGWGWCYLAWCHWKIHHARLSPCTMTKW